MIEGFLKDVFLVGTNQISLSTASFYISYIEYSSVGPETALRWRSGPHFDPDMKFWNLLGDHRGGYQRAFDTGGDEGVATYFQEHISQRSPWSQDPFTQDEEGDE